MRSWRFVRVVVPVIVVLGVAAFGPAAGADEPPTVADSEVPAPAPPDPAPEAPPEAPPEVPDDAPPEVPPETPETPDPGDDPSPDAAAPLATVDAALAAADRLSVTKAVQPGDPAGSFPITLRRCSNASCSSVSAAAPTVNETQNIASGATVDFTTPLVDGSRYRLVETTPTGWSFVSATCTGTPTGSGAPLSFLFAPPGVMFVHSTGTSWSCTFTNANNKVRITKDSDDPSASFAISLQRCSGVYLANACLGSQTTIGGGPASWSDGTTHEFTDLPGGGMYRAIEQFTAGHRLTSVTCSGGPTIPNFIDLALSIDGQTFSLNGANPTRDCTFVNTQNRITVTKETSPSGSTTDFVVDVEKCDFSVFANCIGAFSPVAGSPLTLSDGESGTVTGIEATLFDRFFQVTEQDPGSSWTTPTVVCTGQFGIGSPVAVPLGQAFTFSLNKNVPAVADCLITNQSTLPNGITLSKTASPTTAVPGNTITYSYVVTNTGPGAVTGLTVVDTPLGPVANLAPTALAPGQTATGTLTRLVTAADANTTILNTAVATGTVTCPGVCTNATVQVTATASTSVTVGSAPEVAGVRASTGSGQGTLPFTGSSDGFGSLALVGVAALIGGLLVTALVWRRRRPGLEGPAPGR